MEELSAALSHAPEYCAQRSTVQVSFFQYSGTDAHHVHQAPACQDYHSQHAPRLWDGPQPAGVFGPDAAADGAGAEADTPLR